MDIRAADSIAISVALCTFNGERYLREQLDSLVRQTVLPSELVVGDDLSTDKTMAILQAFQAEAPFPVRISQNDRKLGVTQNFCATLNRCNGDSVALCDQDDVWLPAKLETIRGHFTREPQVEAVFTDATIIDSTGKHVGDRLSDTLKYDAARVHSRIRENMILKDLCRRNICTGATMLLRRDLLSVVLPFPDIPESFMIHDQWIAIVAAARGSLRYLDHPLIEYRRHSSQQIGARAERLRLRDRTSPSYAERRNEFSAMAAQLKKTLQTLKSRVGCQQTLSGIQSLIDYYEWRSALPLSGLKRLIPVAEALVSGTYHRNSDTPLLSLISDLVL
jgi:glycosyltransferase involved in cell wall biosynthesis